MKPILLLMNGTLRLDDHPALVSACSSGAGVIPMFILDDAGAGDWKLGGARRWWLKDSLIRLATSLEARGSRLILRAGDTADIVESLLGEVSAVYMTRAYSPMGRRAQEQIHQLCSAHDTDCRRFTGNLLLEPEDVRTKTGGIYEVFSPFWRRAVELIDGSPPLGAPDQVPAPDNWPESQDITELKLDPRPAHWVKPIAATWVPGEDAAQDRLAKFLTEAARDYKAMRDVPGVEATSRLSPYLAHGEISPRRIWAEAQLHMMTEAQDRKGADWFLRELGWREFSKHLLFHNPTLPVRPLKAQFEDFPWREGVDDMVVAWQKGRTGFPIVDAGMRQLWQTGWMHNRVRMIVASFLVKDMLWHWRTGEDWFWDTLVDADLANNAASWQWVAGCGADAAPYFRIFNPITQGEKFDPDGDYIRTYVPELADMPNDYIHKPFEAPEGVLKMAGVSLGATYPEPVLDRKACRERALAALQSIKKQA
ncbi:cryptochrome/photolyase family protein [Kordiimonas lacus]|uniref:Deoxyribodipyrimidine photo-lyase n=1 Tax=Kordiimonas lacus TaxID=637679 RepID=A0A1G6ZM87_9PROT|nr:deoxyribodipyrimidine photo-lyase [Kordiimonas lacus]SDE02915.1 deoxyribodipyrimidine photo-lyase [Kordiimonas lacus]